MVMLQLSGSYGRVDDLPSFRRTVLVFSVLSQVVMLELGTLDGED